MWSCYCGFFHEKDLFESFKTRIFGMKIKIYLLVIRQNEKNPETFSSVKCFARLSGQDFQVNTDEDDTEAETVHTGVASAGGGGPRGSFLSKLTKLTRRQVLLWKNEC